MLGIFAFLAILAQLTVGELAAGAAIVAVLLSALAIAAGAAWRTSSTLAALRVDLVERMALLRRELAADVRQAIREHRDDCPGAETSQVSHASHR